jgi:phosphoribosylamine--glycine ligase
MKILMIGSGGREHALLWKLRQDAPDAELFVTRGNAGTGELATSLPLDPADTAALAAWAGAQKVNLTVVGPEDPLAAGIVDVFQRQGLPVFGPTRAAAAIESSKAYAKATMRRAGVPTADYRAFSEPEAAESYIRARGAPIVVKASGLAAGKGAVVCTTVAEAIDAAHGMLRSHIFGTAGQEIVVEEFMQGEEVSVFALTDGTNVLTLLPAQDYKRIAEGDQGPNTGGMGACAPVTVIDDVDMDQVRREILLPTLAALRADGHPFRGLLYAGLMITHNGPRVVEFNARFGDPETEVLLPLLESSLLEPMLAIARGQSIAGQSLRWRQAHSLTTVVAAGGYPGRVENGKEIHIPEWVRRADDVIVFHAGTRLAGGRILTAGGRVLAVTALGATLEAAAQRSRAAAAAIEFEGRQFRADIGWRELQRHARAS